MNIKTYHLIIGYTSIFALSFFNFNFLLYFLNNKNIQIYNYDNYNYLYFLLLDIISIISFTFWGFFNHNSYFLTIDRLFVRILFIALFLKSYYHYNYYIYIYPLLSSAFYLFGRFLNYNTKNIFIYHILFRFFAMLWLYNLFIKKYLHFFIINSFIYFLNIYNNYHKYNSKFDSIDNLNNFTYYYLLESSKLYSIITLLNINYIIYVYIKSFY